MTVSAPPIDFHGSIGLWNGTTGEDHVVDVSSYFPRIFGFKIHESPTPTTFAAFSR
jgi:hypothetical protein